MLSDSLKEMTAKDGLQTMESCSLVQSEASFTERHVISITSPGVLPVSFVDPLKTYILGSRSHIATLNYDDLLYRQFIHTPVFSGFSCMIDGFLQSFDNDNLRRTTPSRQCYYLHLHGSLLFITQEDGSIVKKSLSSISGIAGHQSVHLDLTHIQYKRSIISSSPLLLSYWNRLVESLNEVDRVTILGYGGGDTHLNDLINISGKPVRVVERRGDKSAWDSKKYWEGLVGSDVTVEQVDNILNFTTWD